MGERKMRTKPWLGSLMERNYSEVIGEDGRIKLK
jgi:hypothetical protein